jgi:hypothetical protein
LNVDGVFVSIVKRDVLGNVKLRDEVTGKGRSWDCVGGFVRCSESAAKVNETLSVFSRSSTRIGRHGEWCRRRSL